MTRVRMTAVRPECAGRWNRPDIALIDPYRGLSDADEVALRADWTQRHPFIRLAWLFELFEAQCIGHPTDEALVRWGDVIDGVAIAARSYRSVGFHWRPQRERTASPSDETEKLTRELAVWISAPTEPHRCRAILAWHAAKPAAGIFQGLHNRFGRDDTDNALRIAIIRGVRASNPHAYAVIVGPNIDLVPTDAATLFQFVSRVQIMTPASSLNLDRFLAEFSRHSRYVLIAAHLPKLNGPPTPIKGTELGKHHLTVRQAWQIGGNDPDIVALDPDDPPVIPPNQPDAPVLKAIKRRLRKSI